MSDSKLSRQPAPQVEPEMRPVSVKNVSGVWRLRIPSGATTTTFSPPGHLLHFLVAGSYEVEIGSKRFTVSAGDVIYYDGVEEVTAENSGESVIFYSVSFQAPELRVSRIGSCVFRKMAELEEAFGRMYQDFNTPELPGKLRMISGLFAVLGALAARAGEGGLQEGCGVWSHAERIIRDRHDWRISIPELCDELKVSASRLHRSCRRNCGVSPGKRIFQLRMEEARGLLRFTDLAVSDIAEELGYARLHDFSRDATKYFGHSASVERGSHRE